MGKLSGIKVVDLSLFLPGPMLSQLMADHGANVVKIEPISGDPTSALAPFENDKSIWFENTNRGKKLLRLNLKDKTDSSKLLDLVKTADVFIEGFRPGAIKRLGFDYETLKELNPSIIYCSISAFGQTGDLSSHPAHDMAVQAHAGFMSLNDGEDGLPVVPAVPSADMAAGLTGLSAILMALYDRSKSQKGDYIDCSMLESLMAWSPHLIGHAIHGGQAPRSKSQRSTGGAAFYNVYQTKDDKSIVLAGREEKFVKTTLAALEILYLLPDALTSEELPQAKTKAALKAIFKTKTQNQWIEFFKKLDVAFAPVMDFNEAVNQQHFRDRKIIIQKNKNHYIACPIRFGSYDFDPIPASEL